MIVEWFSEYAEAIEFAVLSHQGQTRWSGEPYVTHPIRVAKRAWSFSRKGIFSDLLEDTHRSDIVIAAILHDVVEDCDVTTDDLEERFGQVVADAVDHLTRREGETYTDYVARCKKNPIARLVKYADLHDNLSDLDPDHGLYGRYQKALKSITAR